MTMYIYDHSSVRIQLFELLVKERVEKIEMDPVLGKQPEKSDNIDIQNRLLGSLLVD